MRSLTGMLTFFALTVLAVGAEVAKDQPVMLPPMVVSAPPGSLLFTLSFSSKLPLPFSKVTRASFKKVFPGVVKDAGVSDGDELLRYDGVEVKAMTVMDMRKKVKLDRAAGTKEEFLIRTAKGEVRLVTVVYEEKKRSKAEAAEGAAPGGRGAP